MSNSNLEMPVEVLKVLQDRYNILAHLNFLQFDFDFTILRDQLTTIKKQEFDPTDRIIIEHQDTDFYIKECSVGINLRNFFCVVFEIDLPLYLFVFYTNHFGLTKELDMLCQTQHVKDRPTVIESFLSTRHHDPTKIMPVDFNVDAVEFNMLCMMHLTRSHRNAVYNALQDTDSQKLALAGTNART